MYLHTGTEPTFATLHLPRVRTSAAIGVVLCPPFGWDEYCTHRARRAWADSLAAAGYPAMRIDLPGTGDSAGSSLSPGQLESWTSSVAAAAAYLRDDEGCGRVAAIGLGFGGMLAWLAAAEHAPVDDLILWAVPTRGRRLLREIRAAAMLGIDSRLHQDPDPGTAAIAADPVLKDALVDEAGQVTTQETFAALNRIELEKIPLPEPARRHVLVFERSGVKADADLSARLRDQGAAVTVANGDSYGDLMRYVQAAVTPYDVIDRSIGWLRETSAQAVASLPGARTAGDAVRHSETAEFRHDGVTIKETPVSLRLPSGTVRGIISQPVDADPVDLSAAFFSGGSDRRVGPNRMWVDVARSWAARGLTTIRFDPSGLGDSDGDESVWDNLRDHYQELHVDRTLELLDAARRHGVPERFVMVGFCSGGYRSLHSAMRDRRVVGVFTVGLPFFRWTWWTVNIRDSWLSWWEPKPGDSQVKARIGLVLRRGLHVLQAGQRAVVRAGQVHRNHGERLMGQLSAQGTELLFMPKSISYTQEQLSMPLRRRRLRRLGRVQVKGLPGDDQRFRPLVSQRFVREELDAGLARVIAAQHDGASPTTEQVARHRERRLEHLWAQETDQPADLGLFTPVAVPVTGAAAPRI